MSESIILPVGIRPYGDINTMNDWQDFVKHYRELVEQNDYRGRLIDTIEEQLDPAEVEKFKQVNYYGQGQSPAETHELLKAKEGMGVDLPEHMEERLGPEHYKMKGEVTE